MPKYDVNAKEVKVVGNGNVVTNIGDITNIGGQIAIGKGIEQHQPGEEGTDQIAIGTDINQVQGNRQVRVSARKVSRAKPRNK